MESSTTLLWVLDVTTRANCSDIRVASLSDWQHINLPSTLWEKCNFFYGHLLCIVPQISPDDLQTDMNNTINTIILITILILLEFNIFHQKFNNLLEFKKVFQIFVELKAIAQLCVNIFCTAFIELLLSIDSTILKKCC